jgi:hypothetical protein
VAREEEPMKKKAKKLEVLKKGARLNLTALTEEEQKQVAGGGLGCGGPNDCVAVRID